MSFLKCLGSGVAAAVLLWLVSIVVLTFRIGLLSKSESISGRPIAIAGGWDYLLRSPAVVILLTAAFGTGFYLCARHLS